MAFEENNPKTIEFKEAGDELTGVLLKIQDNVGPSKSMLYTLEVDKKPVIVWGSTVLNIKMIGLQPGDLIKMIYEGLGEAKPGKNAPKLFKVLVDKPEYSKKSLD